MKLKLREASPSLKSDVLEDVWKKISYLAGCEANLPIRNQLSGILWSQIRDKMLRQLKDQICNKIWDGNWKV